VPDVRRAVPPQGLRRHDLPGWARWRSPAPSSCSSPT
jgi:hypothetical protein